MKKTLLTLAIAIIFSVSPVTVSAVSLDDLQAQIASLLRVVAQLQEQLAQTESSSPTVKVVLPSPSQTQCKDFTYNLYLGKRDNVTNGEVSKLQQFLKDQGIYFGLVGGYFGPATERAVQSWQRNHGVVSSGTPDSTGYGVVGPTTRAEMRCGNSDTVDRDLYSSKGFLIADTQSGDSPLTVNFKTDIISGNTSDELIFIDFGDGSEQIELTPSLSNCQSCFGFGGYAGPPLEVSHTYTTPRVYTARIISDSNYYREIQEKIIVSGIQTETIINNKAPELYLQRVTENFGAGSELLLTIGASDPEDDFIIHTIEWGDGRVTTSPQKRSGKFAAGHVYLRAGIYRINSTVRDIYGNSTEKTTIITVGNQPQKRQEQIVVSKVKQPYGSLALARVKNMPILKFKLTGDKTTINWLKFAVSGAQGVVRQISVVDAATTGKVYGSILTDKVNTEYLVNMGDGFKYSNSSEFTLLLDMETNLDKYAGVVISAGLVQVGTTNAMVTGDLPIYGAQHTVNTTMSPCNPDGTVAKQLGYDADCSIQSIQLTPGGTSRMYVDGQLTVTTKDASRQYAIDTCTQNHASNPTKTLRCTWNDQELYNQGPLSAGKDTTNPQGIQLTPGGTSHIYVDGELTTTTKDASRQYTIDTCIKTHKSNPAKTLRCTWNDEEVYNQGPVKKAFLLKYGPQKLKVGESGEWQFVIRSQDKDRPYTFSSVRFGDNAMSAMRDYLGDTWAVSHVYKTVGTYIINVIARQNGGGEISGNIRVDVTSGEVGLGKKVIVNLIKIERTYEELLMQQLKTLDKCAVYSRESLSEQINKKVSEQLKVQATLDGIMHNYDEAYSKKDIAGIKKIMSTLDYLASSGVLHTENNISVIEAQLQNMKSLYCPISEKKNINTQIAAALEAFKNLLESYGK